MNQKMLEFVDSRIPLTCKPIHLIIRQKTSIKVGGGDYNSET